MHRHLATLAVITAAAALACGDSTEPLTAVGGGSALAQRGGHAHTVNMMDACDPETFNAELGDGACTRNGGVTFANFIAQLEKHGSVGSWRFSPQKVHALVGDELVAVNRGGEAHTFTEVEAFGGGFVADLNALSGNPVPAPECLNFGALVFIPPGGSSSEEIEEGGDELYQCCIHPWMRAIVHARAK